MKHTISVAGITVQADTAAGAIEMLKAAMDAATGVGVAPLMPAPRSSVERMVIDSLAAQAREETARMAATVGADAPPWSYLAPELKQPASSIATRADGLACGVCGGVMVKRINGACFRCGTLPENTPGVAVGTTDGLIGTGTAATNEDSAAPPGFTPPAANPELMAEIQKGNTPPAAPEVTPDA